MADIKNITIDGTTYDLKDAKAREDVSDLNEDIDKCLNAVTPVINDLPFVGINQKLLTNTGVISDFANTDYSVSDYVPVSGRTDYMIDTSANWSNAFYAWYDSNKTFISASDIASASGTWQRKEITVTAPTNAGFIVIAYRETWGGYVKEIEAWENSLTDEVNSINADIQGTLLKKENLIKTIDNSFSIPFTNINGKLLTANGTIVDGSGEFVVTDYIDVTDYVSTTLYVGCSNKFGNGCCAFYDTQYNVISVPLVAQSGSPSTIFQNEPVNVPQNAKYMVLSSSNSGNYISAEYREGYKIAKFTGLKWCCIGDSLTEKNDRTTLNYHDYIARETGISIVNMGLSGSGYKRKYDDNGAFYQRILNTPTDSDVVTIFGSGNDQTYFASEMGTATDTETTTLGGCINTTIDNLYSVIPAVQLGIIAPTPWEDYNPAITNNGMARYTELLKTICEYRSIPFLDLYHESNLRPWDSAFLQYAYSKDGGSGTHPDETGHKLIAGRIRAFLDSLIGSY